MAKSPSKKGKAVMLGVGLDDDGHKRVTWETENVGKRMHQP